MQIAARHLGGRHTLQHGSFLQLGASVFHARPVAQVGIPVIVLEREQGLRLEGSAISLWSNAFRALAALGVAQPVQDAHPPLNRHAPIKGHGASPDGVVGGVQLWPL